ncbi:MAG: succinate dehydrogenase, hydrophobic membrane anchor protein [Hyphomicrobiales bacterium]
MSMRTPLKSVRHLGSAKDGTTHFWQQRLTAVANVPLVIAFVVLVIMLSNASHAEFIATIGSPLGAVIMIATILSVSWHMRLGMQVIIEDYIHSEGLKVLLVIGNTFFTAAIALISVFAVLKLSFGG